MVIRRLVTAVGAVALLVILVATIYLLTQGYRFFAVQSDSMWPAISTGDLAVVSPPRAGNDYKAGEVITFHPTPGYTTTHRIVDVSELGIETKGDANATPDVSRIQPSQVVGVVAITIPYAGYVAVFLQQPLGWLSLVLVLAMIVVVWEIVHKRRDRPGEAGLEPDRSA